MAKRSDLEKALRERYPDWNTFSQFKRSFGGGLIDAQAWNTPELKYENNTKELLRKTDVDPRVKIRLCRHFDLATPEEALIDAATQSAEAADRASQAAERSATASEKSENHAASMKRARWIAIIISVIALLVSLFKDSILAWIAHVFSRT